MFDIGWMELLLIGIVALIVVGPKDLPKMFRTVGQVMGRARGMAREFQRTMEQAAEESGIHEAARDLQSVNKLNLNSASSAARKRAETLMTGQKPAGPKPASSDEAGAAALPKVKAAATVEPASEESAPEAKGDGAAQP